LSGRIPDLIESEHADLTEIGHANLIESEHADLIESEHALVKKCVKCFRLSSDIHVDI
jgi:hypothetical protein